MHSIASKYRRNQKKCFRATCSVPPFANCRNLVISRKLSHDALTQSERMVYSVFAIVAEEGKQFVQEGSINHSAISSGTLSCAPERNAMARVTWSLPFGISLSPFGVSEVLSIVAP